MNIKIMIGNPPYQKEVTDSAAISTQSLYDEFIRLGLQYCEITSLIVPAKWTGDGSDVMNVLRDRVLHEGHLRYIKIYSSGESVFDTVRTGRLSQFLYDKNYKGVTDVYFDENKKLRDLRLETGSLVDNHGVSIFNKLEGTFRLDDIMYGKAFNIKSNDYGVDKTATTIKVFTNKGFVNKELDDIPDKECLEHYNVYVGQCISDGSFESDKNGQYNVLGGHGILRPNEACTDTYFVLGNFDTEQEALNCNKFISTKFVRILILMKAKSIMMNKKIFRNIPIQDFTAGSDINWDMDIEDIDKQLYRKYNLSQEEIDFIERTIKTRKY